MNINATLILQSIAMMIFVWFCMKFIWPPLLKAMDERRERIAEGLAASDRAEKELEKAKVEVDAQISEARDKAGEIVEQANQRHSQIVDQAKEDATAERKRQVTAAEADITQSANLVHPWPAWRYWALRRSSREKSMRKRIGNCSIS